MGGDCEAKPDVHAAGIALHRRVDELFNLGKRHDLVELAVDLPLLHAQHGAVEIDVLAARKLSMKTRAYLQQRAHTSLNRCPAVGRLGDAGKNLQQCALAGAVAPDNAEHLAMLDLE